MNFTGNSCNWALYSYLFQIAQQVKTLVKEDCLGMLIDVSH